MEKINFKQIINNAISTENWELLDFALGKIYNRPKVESIIFETDYVILGRGIIKKNFLMDYCSRKGLEDITKNFYLISCDEEIKNLEQLIFDEKNTQIIQKKNDETKWKSDLKMSIQKLEISEEEQNIIFDIILNTPLSKKELEPDYWKVYDIVNHAEKTKQLFNFNPDISLNKNDFPKKKRNNKEE